MVDILEIEVGEQFAAFHQVRYAAHVAVGLTGHRGVIQQLLPDHFAQEFVLRQVVCHQVVVGQLVDLAHAMHQHHLFEALIGFRVADDAHERCQAGAGGQQIKPSAGQQVVDQQRAGGLAAHQYGVAHLNVLQARGQRPFLDLDAQELEVLLIIGADDAVGTHQRLAVDAQADHGEVAVGKTQRRVARGGEGEQALGPVVDAQHAFLVEGTHGMQTGWKNTVARFLQIRYIERKCSECNIFVW